EVSDVNGVARADVDAGGEHELARPAAGRAEVIKQAAFRVEDLYGFKQRVHHVEVAVAVGGNAFGAVQRSGATAELPEAAQKLPVGGQRLDAEVHGVHDVELAAAQGERRGIVEFARAGAAAADGLEHGAAKVQHQHLVAQGIGEINQPPRRVNGESRGAQELRPALRLAQRPQEFPFLVEHVNARPDGVADVDVVLAVHGHAHR